MPLLQGACMDIDIEHLRKGDRETWFRAFEVLYTISMSVCCSNAASLSHQDQEDVAVEAITKLCDYVAKVNNFDECKKLIVTITKNSLRDRFRQLATEKHGAGKVHSLEQQENFDAPDDNAGQPDEIAMDAEWALLLSRALNQVPERYQKVVSAFYIEGLTHQEIADRHGLKIGSIGVYVERGLQALAKALQKGANLT
jgi:RNA polymerase sigma factor (sigma-70 family)